MGRVEGKVAFVTGVKATAPAMVERGQGGSIIQPSSIAGLIAFPNLAHYTAAKHGVTGLMRTLAVELAAHRIRVNSVHPTTVDTPMIAHEPICGLFMGGVRGATREQAVVGMKAHVRGSTRAKKPMGERRA